MTEHHSAIVPLPPRFQRCSEYRNRVEPMKYVHMGTRESIGRLFPYQFDSLSAPMASTHDASSFLSELSISWWGNILVLDKCAENPLDTNYKKFQYIRVWYFSNQEDFMLAKLTYGCEA